jgi:hypothetical protein
VYAHCLLFSFHLNGTVLPHITVTLIWSWIAFQHVRVYNLWFNCCYVP